MHHDETPGAPTARKDHQGVRKTAKQMKVWVTDQKLSPEELEEGKLGIEAKVRELNEQEAANALEIAEGDGDFDLSE